MSSILDRIDEIEASMDEREAESNTAQTKRKAGGSEGDLIRSLDEDLTADPDEWEPFEPEPVESVLPEPVLPKPAAEPDDGLEMIDFSDLPDEPPTLPQPEQKPAKQETTADRYVMDLQKSFASFKQGLQDDLKDLSNEAGMDAKSMRRENVWEETEDRRENFSSDRIYTQEQANRDEAAAKDRAEARQKEPVQESRPAAARADAVYAKPVNFDDLVFEEAELFEEAARTGAEKSRLAPFEDDLFEEEFEQEERPASRSRTAPEGAGGPHKKLRAVLLIIVIVIAVLLVVFWLNAFGVF